MSEKKPWMEWLFGRTSLSGKQVIYRERVEMVDGVAHRHVETVKRNLSEAEAKEVIRASEQEFKAFDDEMKRTFGPEFGPGFKFPDESGFDHAMDRIRAVFNRIFRR